MIMKDLALAAVPDPPRSSKTAPKSRVYRNGVPGRMPSVAHQGAHPLAGTSSHAGVGTGRRPRTPARCDLDHVESLRPPEIDSDTRPFRIDRSGNRRLLTGTTRIQASTFPVPRTSFK